MASHQGLARTTSRGPASEVSHPLLSRTLPGKQKMLKIAEEPYEVAAVSMRWARQRMK